MREMKVEEQELFTGSTSIPEVVRGTVKSRPTFNNMSKKRISSR